MRYVSFPRQSRHSSDFRMKYITMEPDIQAIPFNTVNRRHFRDNIPSPLRKVLHRFNCLFTDARSEIWQLAPS